MKIRIQLKLVFFLTLFIWSCNSKAKTTATETTIEVKKRPLVEMKTTHGTMIMELYNETPLHRDNFIKLVEEKSYDSLLFHRVIENFMIQGGDPDSRNATSETMLGEGDLDYTIDAEFHPDLFHKKGALATAREETLGRVSSAIQFYIVQGKPFNDSLLDASQDRINTMLARHHVLNDTLYKPLWLSMKDAIKVENRDLYKTLNDSINSVADSYTSFKRYTIPTTHREVYKTIGGTPHLDQNYTVFGQVIDGLEVVDSIAKTKTDDANRPMSGVRIVSVKLKNE